MIVNTVLLLAACIGTIPADNCLLMLAGHYCEHSQVCNTHDLYHDADEADSHDEHAPESVPGDHPHHTFCVKILADSLAGQTQRAPTFDLHQLVLPIFASAVVLNAPFAQHNAFELRQNSGPPPSSIFKLTHSYLI